MQHHITSRADNTSNRQSICATGLHQNLNRAFVLFELTPANEISLLDPYERTLGKCCVDPLRPPLLSECGPLRAANFQVQLKLISPKVREVLRSTNYLSKIAPRARRCA